MKPILFSTPMVRAILDGRKTMTRRVVRPQGIKCYKGVYCKPCGEGYVLDVVSGSLYCAECGNIIEYSPEGKDYCKTIDAPYFPGDILWVRETWQKLDSSMAVDLEPDEYCYVYKASENGQAWARETENWKWEPSIFMPKEAARIFLRVTNIRVERVQDITEEDAMAEGVRDPYDYQEPAYYEQLHMRGLEINQSAFAGLWDSLNAKRGYGWDANPWVWVYEFERCEKLEY